MKKWLDKHDIPSLIPMNKLLIIPTSLPPTAFNLLIENKPKKFYSNKKNGLTCKGFTKSHRNNNEEKFSPATKLNQIKLLLLLTTNPDWLTYQVS